MYGKNENYVLNSAVSTERNGFSTHTKPVYSVVSKFTNYPQTNNQTNFSESLNLATTSRSNKSVNRCNQNSVLNFTTSDSIDDIVSKINEKKNELTNHRNIKQIKPTMCLIDLTIDEKCENQIKSNQCYDTQQSTATNLVTKSKKYKNINKTDNCVSQMLPPSNTLERISNKKSEEPKKSLQSQSFSIDLTNDEICDNQHPLSDSTDLASNNKNYDTIDLTIEDNCDYRDKYDQSCNTQPSSVNDLEHSTIINKNYDVPNITNHHKTQQLFVSNTFSLATKDNCDYRDKFDQSHNTQQLSGNDPKHLTIVDKNYDVSNITNHHKSQQSIVSNNIDMSIINKNCNDKKNIKQDVYKHNLDAQSLIGILNKGKTVCASKKIKTYRHSKKNLSAKSNLKTPKKPFYCKICKINFTKTIDYKLHMQTHTGYKLLKNSHPNWELKISEKNHKLKKTDYDCYLCFKSFLCVSNLKTHFYTDHSKTFQCDKCKVYVNNKLKLVSHVQSHLKY